MCDYDSMAMQGMGWGTGRRERRPQRGGWHLGPFRYPGLMNDAGAGAGAAEAPPPCPAMAVQIASDYGIWPNVIAFWNCEGEYT